jgi:hypothetical protein
MRERSRASGTSSRLGVERTDASSTSATDNVELAGDLVRGRRMAVLDGAPVEQSLTSFSKRLRVHGVTSR